VTRAQLEALSKEMDREARRNKALSDNGQAIEALICSIEVPLKCLRKDKEYYISKLVDLLNEIIRSSHKE